MRPRRSMLYVPGANARALAKARELDCDGLILDLEDSVAPDAKPAARDAVVAALATGYGPREVAVRINGRGTEWCEDDIVALVQAGADALVVPKCDDAATVAETDRRLAAAGAPASLALWCMIETPAGVLNAREIAAASPRMGALLLGAADLTKALGARDAPGRPALATAIGLVILAARAGGIAVLDSPVLRPFGRRGIRAVVPRGPHAGVRRQDADPPQDHRRRQRRLWSGSCRGGGGAAGRRRVRGGRRAWPGRHAARRKAGRRAARRGGAPPDRTRRRHRRARIGAGTFRPPYW